MKPDFSNLLKVLAKQKPDRPTLFEFFLNEGLEDELAAGETIRYKDDGHDYWRKRIRAFKNAGYDYTTVSGSAFHFPHEDKAHDGKKSYSLNERVTIYDRRSFESYKWPNADEYGCKTLDGIKDDLPDGMKYIICGPGGVLENVISLMGYDNLCMMLYDDPELVQDIFGAVGSCLLGYYENCAGHETVGAIISNDDWGFNTQTMLSSADMRKYVFPWHEKIAAVAHKYGKPAILHSCGMLEDVMDDVIDVIKFDGKHSYEDNIIPVEDSYEKYVGRIATLGGIDLNFVCMSKPEEIEKRCESMLERSAERGCFALGTGNSVPYYVPNENYYAMIDMVRKTR